MFNIYIMSVNMHCSNVLTHALLASNPPADIILIQEPWYGYIGTCQSDIDPASTNTLRGVASPLWNFIYPGLVNPGTTRAKIMAYSHKTNPIFTVSNCLNLVSHPSLMTLEVIMGDDHFLITNVYHNTNDPTCLQMLFNADFDPTIPAIFIGNFNMHSPTWSPSGLPHLRWAHTVEDWAALNLLNLLNPPGGPTRFGEGPAGHHQRDSTIDLAWINATAVQDNSFHNFTIDRDASLDSDHAALLVMYLSPANDILHAPAPSLGFAITPDHAEEWTRNFLCCLLQPLATEHDINTKTTLLHNDIEQTSAQTLSKKKPFSP